MISGFTFCHNCLSGGLPIVEAVRAVRPYVDEIVAVDMQSIDGTRDLLHWLGCRVIPGKWGNQAGETLRAAHALYRQCKGDVILHFEADEVYDGRLLQAIRATISEGFFQGVDDLAVYRLQLEQNFQRCRWYPEPVHRVWRRDSDTIKEGHTSNRHREAAVIDQQFGYLWDITNCFRDNWRQRVNQQAELWNETPKYRMVPFHAGQPFEVSANEAEARLNEPHWTWKTSPFDLPPILKPLVGMTRYEARL